MTKRKASLFLLSLISIAVAFCVSACSDEAADSASSADGGGHSAFRFLDKTESEIEDAEACDLIPNGAIQQLSAFALANENSVCLRTPRSDKPQDDEDRFFAFENDKVASYLCCLAPNSPTVAELLVRYPDFKDSAPEIVVDEPGYSFLLKWREGGGTLCIWALNYVFADGLGSYSEKLDKVKPEEDYLSFNAIFVSEYTEGFEFQLDLGDSSRIHPEGFEEYLSASSMSAADFEFDDYWDTADVVCDLYEATAANSPFGYVLVEVENAERVFLQVHDDTTPFEVWRVGLEPCESDVRIEEAISRASPEANADWWGGALFDPFFSLYYSSCPDATWDYIGTSESVFSVAEYGFESFSVYRVNMPKGKAYFFVPINTMAPAPTVYVLKSDGTLGCAWSAAV